jgi:hypothetical protein
MRIAILKGGQMELAFREDGDNVDWRQAAYGGIFERRYADYQTDCHN